MRIQLSFQFETILARQRDTFARKGVLRAPYDEALAARRRVASAPR